MTKTNSFYPVAEPDIGLAEENAIMDAVRSGWVSSLGKYISEFENSFANFCGSRFAVTVSNGTTALHLTMVAANIGPGDEVLVPALTFVATAAAVRHAGATPVLVDCDPVLGTICPEAAKHAITERTRALIAVHLYGHPAEMQPLQILAESHGFLLIEDAAEAHGAYYLGNRTGSLGHVATFSFYGNKILTTGEGGMIVTNDEILMKRLCFLRDHAMDTERRYWHPEVGYNYRMTNLQAALGTAQLARFEEITAKRAQVLGFYRSYLPSEDYLPILNPEAVWATPVPWLVCAILPVEMAWARDPLCNLLRQAGIDTRPFFIPMHLLPPYACCRRVAANGQQNLIGADTLAKRGFNLPSSGSLTKKDIAYIVDVLVQSLDKIRQSQKRVKPVR